MKIEIIKGTYNNGKEVVGAGKIIDVDKKEAQSLINLGMAREVGTGTQPQTETPEQKAARELAEKRVKLEEKALELKIGTAEEVKALSLDDLKEKLAKAGGEGIKGFFNSLFGGGNR